MDDVKFDVRNTVRDILQFDNSENAIQVNEESQKNSFCFILSHVSY
jgi:hypothetical protein